MKTIIYFLSVLAVLLCTSPGLFSQQREIGEIKDGKPVITNAANVALYFKSVYGAGTELNSSRIQWSKEYRSYFLVGITTEGKTTGLQLQSNANKLNAADGPKLEIFCRSDGDCHLCTMSDAICECLDVNTNAGSCRSGVNNVTSAW